MGRALVLCLLMLILATTANSSVLAANPFDCSCDNEVRQLKLSSPLMSGEDVEELQAVLQLLGFYDGPITGTFGPLTEAAVMSFQEWVRLDPVGEVGPRTRAALSIAMAEQRMVMGVVTTEAPPSGDLRLVVDLDKKTLTVMIDDKAFKVFPCAVGKFTTKSPVGEWAVVHKGIWGGGFGTRWMGLNVPWGIYGIHGTNKPGSIGTNASAGCIRMYNRDVEKLYPWVKVGTRVSIVGDYPRIKVTSPISKGTTGHAVQQVQLSLREVGFSPGFTDGRYGKDTEAAVQKLQTHFGLPATGQVDLNVLTLLRLR